MANRDDAGGISALVRHTAGMAELAVSAGHPDRKHNEYLPYPDNTFTESVDQRFQRAEKFTIEYIYNPNGKTFVSGVPVYVKYIVAERIRGGVTDFLNPYLYCITTRHGPFEWTIYKRYRHFHNLHNDLVDFVKAETRRSISDINEDADEDSEYPCFPTRNDRMAFINDSMIRERCKILTEYLNKVLKHPKFRDHQSTREFFGVSSLSFVHGLSASIKEGYLLKRSHDDYRGQKLFFRLPFFCDSCKFHHGRKWFVIKDSYILYIRPDLNEIRFPMLVDRAFEVSKGIRKAKTYHGFKVRNLQRTMLVKCPKKHHCDEWTEHLMNLKEQAKGFIDSSFSRFSSFAPIREKQLAYWFINGKSYMEAVAKALLTAKEEVFITDWWLSPEIMMVRPSDDPTHRLDLLLGKIADAGVRVYVMVYKEVTLAVGLNSLYTKRALVSKSKNGFIKVLRHPNHYPKGGVLFWSHHEKLVIIDQKIAFVGGIDLCYGRWDDEFMRLVDLGEDNDRNLKMPSQIAAEDAARGGIETVEVAEKVTTQMAEQAGEIPANTSRHMKTSVSAPNKASEDVKFGIKGQSLGTEDRLKNAVQKWSESRPTGNPLTSKAEVKATHQKAVRQAEGRPSKWKKITRKIKSNQEDDSEDEENFKDLPTPVDPLPTMDMKRRYFVGKDYSNAYTKDFEILEKYDEDYIDRKTVPRMPWHDEALVVFGKAARDVARHFIQRWNIHKCEKYLNNMNYPFLLPKSYDDEEDLTVRKWKEFLDGQPYKVNAQCVRSVGPWSLGTRTIEASIQNAYIQMIDAAKHYIYVENQFFVTISDDSVVRNQLSDAFFRRILRAHTSNEKFRVYVILPLLPGFDNIKAVQAVLYFIMRSISKGDESLFKRLEKAGVPPNDYISFFGMRAHDILMGRLVTEIIYVHSKLMIIDDRMAICGSANINDRSLVGDRDSEVGMVINDIEEEDGVFNGQAVRVGKFCSSWRKRLFQMMLGIQFENPNKIDINDPISDQFYNSFRDTARKNTLIYEEVFATLPSNRVKNFRDLPLYTDAPKLRDTDPVQSQEKLKGIQGVIVEYPLYFLDEENYLPGITTREGMAPNVMWT